MDNKKRKKKKLISVNNPTIIVQEWKEYEREQILGSVGWSLHLEERDRISLIDAFWEREKITFRGGMPLRYIREEGQPFVMETRKDIYEQLKELRIKGKYGIWINSLELLKDKLE